MDELKLTGNCLKGSRPLLNFDDAFDSEPHWQLLKEMFFQVGETKFYYIVTSLFLYAAGGLSWVVRTQEIFHRHARAIYV